MNSKKRQLFCFAALALISCESSPEVSIPQFPDGGMLRTGTPLSRAQLLNSFEGMYGTASGSDVFGDRMAVRTSPGTVSLLTDKNAGFSVLEAACLPDRRVVLEGYWQWPTRVEAGLVRLFVEPPAVAEALCNGEEPAPDTDFTLSGLYGEQSEFPAQPFRLEWQHELKEWRGRFFTVAHHGACEITDHCGASPNSIESVRLSERVGSNAAELDVRATRDGVPIFFHDPGMSGALVKGTFCKGKVAELSLAEIRGSCQLEYGEVIPTVQELLDVMVNETELEGVYLDMKVPEAVLESSRIASRLNTQLRERNENSDPTDDRRFAPLIAITTDEVLAAWHAAKVTLADEGLEIPNCLLEYDPDKVLEEGCVAWGPTWTEGPKAPDVHRLQDEGVGTIFWTINQSEFIDRFLMDAHPNGIISARAALVFFRYQTLGTLPPPTGPQQ
jgi:glycerophosphoryl diester phosphodiesterase